MLEARTTRVNLNGYAMIYADGKRISCRTLNLSTSGMALACPVRLNPGQQLRIEFIPCESLGSVHLHSVLVRCHARGRGYLLGLKFEDLDSWLEGYLESLVAERLKAEAVA